MAATKGDMPFRDLYTKRLSSLIAAMGSSYAGCIVSSHLIQLVCVNQCGHHPLRAITVFNRHPKKV